jgi:hypothetical protein
VPDRPDRAKLAEPGNDFSWSSFEDHAAALAEIDELSVAVRAGGPPPFALTVLFAPTGPIQEVSLSSLRPKICVSGEKVPVTGTFSPETQILDRRDERRVECMALCEQAAGALTNRHCD